MKCKKYFVILDPQFKGQHLQNREDALRNALKTLFMMIRINKVCPELVENDSTH